MMRNEMRIRPVVLEDARRIATIYNHYIRNSIATFEEHELSESEMRDRISRINKNYPYLVGELDGEVMGYAYASQWKPRSAYRHSAETSVYLDHTVQGKGYGSQLYIALIQEVKPMGLTRLIGGISLPNEASVRLHESLGYRYVGTFPEVGYKFDQWIDVGYWQLNFD